MANEIRNADIIEILAENGVMDADDGEMYAKPVHTADTLADFKAGAEFSSEKTKTFDGIRITTLEKFQKVSGTPRKTLFYIDFQNEAQNIAILF